MIGFPHSINLLVTVSYISGNEIDSLLLLFIVTQRRLSDFSSFNFLLMPGKGNLWLV